MRLFEFVSALVEREMTASNPAISNIPSKYPIDPDTELALNTENQWSRSPYLYAVNNAKGNGYYAQIHIPQSMYREHIADLHSRWPAAPESLFNDVGQGRMVLKVPFSDPRQAAWFAQNVLYSVDADPKDIILDKLDQLYSQRNDADGHLWNELRRRVPTFSGTPLKSEDAEEFFKDKEKFMLQKAERDASIKKRQVLSKNAGSYEDDRKKQIKKELTAWFKKMGPGIMKKKLGKALTDNELSARMDSEIEGKGIDFFLTSPGSVKMKDIGSISF